MLRSTLVLAMTVDGKITNTQRDPAQFASRRDFEQLEKQVAAADGVLIGAGTLRAHSTTMRVISEDLICDRLAQGLSPQPVQIVVSRSGALPKTLKFFQQPVPRWLLTTETGAMGWVAGAEFQRILIHPEGSINWPLAWQQLTNAGIAQLCILGGAEVATDLWQLNLIDELRLTICPFILGGASAPTLCEGSGLEIRQGLKLVECQVIDDEIFMHYRRVTWQ